MNQIVLVVVLDVLQQHITDKTAILFGEYNLRRYKIGR